METITPIDRINRWVKNSVMLKLSTITILVLLLLIPSSMIKSIIWEREQLNNDAIQEVSSKWANEQTIHGPILTIPLLYEQEKEDEIYEVVRYLHLLPEDLTIDGTIDPEQLQRGIYKIIVYQSSLKAKGKFLIEEKADPSNLKSIQWNQAFLTLGITDLRGIEEQIWLTWNGQKLQAEPGSRIPSLIASGVTFEIPDLQSAQEQEISFAFDLSLQGSQNMSFIPIGSETDISLNSRWSSPSFNGNFLPDSREVGTEGFQAKWQVLQLNRNFPQTWIGNQYAKSMNNTAFGVDLILPLDDYQKSMRSAKYAIMTIALTFLIFFLVEITNQHKIHPFQYTLVGLALCLFYVLLVSISEHTSFNLAYMLSALAVMLMITLYSTSILKKKKLILLLTIVLMGVYGFLFVTLQLADYALLMGSTGLAVILSVTMYFTRNINWYELSK
ncbi:MAG: cell envelope integrity protein CreD [Cyclobacteriaceae bacterium]|nr:cell envelope integrity protein CreD [Cyclobacteriaceae bacterium HetDA_MAG_MS6]